MTQNGLLKGFRKVQSLSLVESRQVANQTSPVEKPDTQGDEPSKQEIILCRKCRSQLFPHYRFCLRCGYPTDQAENPVPLTPASPVQATAIVPIPANAPQSTIDVPKLDQVSWSSIAKKSNIQNPGSFRLGSNDEVNGWLKLLVRGSEQQVQEAFDQLIMLKSAQIIPFLGSMLNKRIKAGNPEREDKAALLLVVKGMESPETIQQVIQFKLPDDHEIARLFALGYAQLPVELPYLKKYLANSNDLINRCLAIIALTITRLPEAIPILFLDAEDEFMPWRTEYIDDDVNVLGWSNSLALHIIGNMVADHQRGKINPRLAAWLTNPDLPLAVIAHHRVPGDVRLMYVLHLKAAAISALALNLGVDALRQFVPQVKDATERILLAMAMIDDSPGEGWIPQAMAKSIKSIYWLERLLAYECAVRIMVKTDMVNMKNFVTAGLNDQNPLAQDAVAAAIMYQGAERLYPLAYERLLSGMEETRMALIFPIVDIANKDDPQAMACLNDLIHRDPDRKVRELAAEVW